MPSGPERIPLRIPRPARPADGGGGSYGGAREGLAGRGAGVALIVALSLGGLGLGWSLFSNAIADALAGPDPQAALSWKSEHPAALSALAAKTLDDGDPKAAAELSRRALAVDPLDVRAIRVLGLSAERTGDTALAEKLLKDAGARSRRDGPTQLWLFARNAATGDYDEAFARADALMRDRPELATRFYPVMADLAARPEATDALVRRLRMQPPWRDGFVQTYIRQAFDPGRPYALLERMEATGVKLSPVERKAMMMRLVQGKHYQQAFVFWVQSLGRADLESLADIRNGEFRPHVEDGPFNWTIEGPAKNFVEFTDAPDREGGALDIVFTGGPAPIGFVRQLLVLSPGQNVLSGEVKADQFQALAGPVWQVRCADGNQLLGETEPLTSSTGWRRFELRFEVPATGCEAQWLRLRLPGRDRQMSGEVWYDKLAISR